MRTHCDCLGRTFGATTVSRACGGKNKINGYENRKDMTTALITTIIPTFRRPMLLRRSIESVLVQSFKDLKICVYDNASGDETEEVVAEYIRRDDRVFYVKNDHNLGAINNMIKGVEAVSTEFYLLLNDDDFLLPDFYESAMREFERCPRAGFVCTGTIVVDVANKKMQYRNRDWVPGVYDPSNVVISKMFNSHFVTTGVVWRRDMRQLVGSFEKKGSDLLLMTMAAACSPFVVLNGHSAVFTIHKNSYSAMGGVGREDIYFFYDALLSIVDQIMTMDVTKDRKVHLLSVITNAYLRQIEIKQIKLKSENRGALSDVFLPSRITDSGFIITLYELLPTKLHHSLTYCIWLIMRIKEIRRRHKALDATWLELPETVKNLIFNFDNDFPEFLSCVNK